MASIDLCSWPHQEEYNLIVVFEGNKQYKLQNKSSLAGVH